MFRFGIKNLRRLREFSPAQIRPVTILVGRNSSGKSTFLRTFPLLRQSITTRTSSPILWYGDWVDFGNFEGAVSDHDTDTDMSFFFKVDNVRVENSSGGDVYLFDDSVRVSHGDVTLEVNICKYGEGTRIKSFSIFDSINSTLYEVKISESGTVSSININGKEAIQYVDKDLNIFVSNGTILPLVHQAPKESIRTSIVGASDLDFYFRGIASSALVEYLSPYLHKGTKAETIKVFSDRLSGLRTVSKEEIVKSSKQIMNRSWRKFIGEIASSNNEHIYEVIRSMLLLNNLPHVLKGASDRLKETLSSTLYIGPARAKSDRYYRYQDLNVSEIDPDGKNFPMFLNSLSKYQIKAFSDWVENLFGYGVSVLRESGHISIELKYDGENVNIVDTGYGVSQILPVLGQMWWANNRKAPRNFRNEGASQIIAIEQPELHLHPAHQAMLADAFVGTLLERKKDRSEGDNLHFIIETHSETLINKMGELVSRKQIDEDDVQVIVFDVDDQSASHTNARIVKFNSEGELIDWPYGFFLPESR